MWESVARKDTQCGLSLLFGLQSFKLVSWIGELCCWESSRGIYNLKKVASKQPELYQFYLGIYYLLLSTLMAMVRIHETWIRWCRLCQLLVIKVPLLCASFCWAKCFIKHRRSAVFLEDSVGLFTYKKFGPIAKWASFSVFHFLFRDLSFYSLQNKK